MLTPALYRTRITHLRRAPVRYQFAQRGYSWYVNVDELPRLPWWLRPFARFEPRDHLRGSPEQSLRSRIEHVLAGQGVRLYGGQITALLQARVLGFVFNPLSLYWCHDRGGELVAVVAEVHNTYGGRHAYVLAPSERQAATVPKAFYVSPFNEVDGHYLVRAPKPDAALDVTISWHRGGRPAFVATLRGSRRAATAAELARLQLIAPWAPLATALMIRWHGVVLWLRGLPIIARDISNARSGNRI
jgi:uncharacterized protein